eukprot:3566620-Amphidinium_carterae.1
MNKHSGSEEGAMDSVDEPCAAKPGFVEAFGLKLLIMIFLTHHVMVGVCGGMVRRELKRAIEETEGTDKHNRRTKP